jgi:hypothetical protein
MDTMIIGQLNYRGDIREGMNPRVMDSPKHGPVLPAVVEYDEERDITTVGFVSMLTGVAAVAAEDARPSLLDAAKAVR